MKHFSDDVSGQIIGGPDTMGRLYYEGRSQGRTLYSNSDSEIADMAQELLNSMKAEHGEAFAMIWPNISGWEVRII